MKEKYTAAGYTAAGLWSDFSKEVAQLYPGGVVPKKREMRRMAAQHDEDG